jgi:DNA-binding response OmpR family regulator
MEPNETYTVLIIEDNAEMMEALGTTLEAADYKVIKSIDGESGLVDALHKHPDIVLLDLKLPRLNGKKLLSRLRDDPWGMTVPVIVLTNEDDVETIMETVKNSAQGYFIKADTDLQIIVESVQDAIRQTHLRK